MNRNFDVVVVGAGPAGCMCARLCAERGLSVCLIEEHAAIGSPVQCAGLLSLAAFRECEVSDRSILNTVTGARIVSSLGTELEFDAGTPKAHVVDRAMLDREMAEKAAATGVNIRLKTAFVTRRGDRIVTRGVNGREEIPFRILVAADGARSGVARDMGMARAQVFLSGLQGDIVHETDPHKVQIYPDASPEFFGWIIPIGPRRVRIGLAGQENVKQRYFRFIHTPGAYRGSDADREEVPAQVNFVSGTIPLGIMPRTYGDRALFVGDAAGMAKPTSGGGVYTGVRAARHAAAATCDAIGSGDYSDVVLKRYENAWKEDFGTELALGMELFRMRQAMTPEDIARMLSIMKDPEMVDAIITAGDMDRPAKLARKFLTNPKIFPVFGILIKSRVRRIYK